MELFRNRINFYSTNKQTLALIHNLKAQRIETDTYK